MPIVMRNHPRDKAGRRNVVAGHRRGIERSRRSDSARRQMAGYDRQQYPGSKRLNAADVERTNYGKPD
jgi:hypothetical protein